ncbi:hypothetical protein [Plantactinospora sp. GCM10030261]|uniref:hypothetical protein n=1 Tax=Plantactinospora sp. GCM10030261 TaxID=3273420 RepID=UPI00360F7E89
MNVNKRDRRGDLDGQRGAGQGAPRVGRGAGQGAPWSGGRTTAQPDRRAQTTRAQATRAKATGDTSTPRTGRGAGAGTSRARGTRAFPTQGSAALAPSTESARSTRIDRSGTPRLEVAPPPPVRVPRAPFVALIIAVVVGGVLGILLVNTKINENAIRLDKMQQQQATLDLQEQKLKQQIAEAEAPGNLAERAKELGLVKSGPPAFIQLPDGRRVGVPQPAGASDQGGAAGNAGQAGQQADSGQQGAGG